MSDKRLSFEKSKAFTRALERVVPGGAHTYSKGRDQFPENAPNGITHGLGARVWDADGNELIDWSMGLTSVSLGHAHPEVNKAVCDAIQSGVNFQRPAALELQAAETILGLTGTDMVKFAKHGSSVTTAAVKLARAFTGRAKVAVPREHPFFSFDDWFIGITATDSGIPEILKQFSLTFSYNDITSLHALFKAHPSEIACVILEPVKFDVPKDDFLQKVRELCTANGAVLVLDEMVTGLKFGVPGASKYFGIEADLYTYGKGIANGFTAAALTGRGDIMRQGGLEPEGARKLFLLSTTHGAESSGLAAMMKTIEILKDGTLIAANWETGRRIRAGVEAVIARHGLQARLKLVGYPCLLALAVQNGEGQDDAPLRTYLMQEMIARGVLFQGLFYATPSHGKREVEETLAAFDSACGAVAGVVVRGNVDGLLQGPVVKPVFRRNN